MRRAHGLTFLLLIAVLVPACSGPSEQVLFVGNSYTSSNGLPEMVRNLASDVDRKLTVESRAPGGWWWRDHATSPETLDLLRQSSDFVVLQEQSQISSIPALAQVETRPAAATLVSAAREGGARVKLFMTWGHRDGSTEAGHSSYESMQRAVADTYTSIGRELSVEAAPVGMAWWMAREERPDIILYQPDGSHPSSAGTYLAAVVIAASLLDVDVDDFEWSADLDESTASVLRGFAARAMDFEVPWNR